MKKKIVVLVTVCSLIASSFALGAFAASSGMKLWINGKSVSYEVKNIDGVTYIPVKVLSEKLGLGVKVDTKANILSIVNAGNQHSYTSAPQLNVPTDKAATSSVAKISTPSDFNYSVNSADGVKLLWKAKNNTGKVINYYTVNIRTFNPVGDPSYDQLTGKNSFSLKYVGPVPTNGDLIVFTVFTYQGALETIKIDSIDVVYSDGTKETIKYGLSTNKSDGFE